MGEKHSFAVFVAKVGYLIRLKKIQSITHTEYLPKMNKEPKTQEEWTLHALNIHGIFFERLCQRLISESEGWTVRTTNYPVEFPPPNGPIRGKESALDIRAERDWPEHRITILIECKKNNTEFVNWIFFKKRGEPKIKKSHIQP
jgi:hypothetical protein